MTRLVALALATVAFVAACGTGSGSDDEPLVLLDGTPRVSDTAGVVTAVDEDFATIEIDGHTHSLADEVASFAALDGSLHPLLRWVDQYVQVGLRGGEVVWVGGLSAPVRGPDSAGDVFFTDVLVDITADGLVFRSGTVLPSRGDVVVPGTLPLAVVATIDVGTGLVVELELG